LTKSAWPVLVAATIGVTIGHWLVIGGVLLGEGDADRGLEPALIGVGLAVLAVTVIASAVATGRNIAAGAAAAAIGGAVMAAVWLIRSDEVPLPALSAGVVVAAALAVGHVRKGDLRVRLFMTIVIVLYMLWVTGVSGGFAVLVAPLLPYVTVGVSDYASGREADRHMRRSYAGRKVRNP
jgi:hypothetical protein